MSDQKKFEELRDALSPEPVAEWVRADNGNYTVLRWRKDYVATIGDKLYTSAPTVPAALDDFLQKREQDSFSCKQLVADLRVLLAALKAARPALAEFNQHWTDEDGGDPVERLRFFCSLAMTGQDWLDIEPFFDALKQGEPVATAHVGHGGFIVTVRWAQLQKMGFNLDAERDVQLFTSAPTTPAGYVLVPVEPTPEMYAAVDNERLAQLYWRKLLAAAPKGETA